MSFSPFLSLPTELRFKIWEAHCPELSAQAQVFQVEFDPNGDEVRPGEHLWRQTAPVRRILSLCADSRSHALRALPDSISLNKGEGLVRYLATRDLIRLDPEFAVGENVLQWRSVTGFSEHVVNLAFNLARLPWLSMSATHYFRLCLSFPNLRYIFATTWGLGQRPRDLAWIASPKAHRTGLVLLESHEEGGKDLVMSYCWPDVPRHEGWAGAAISRSNMPLSHHATISARQGVRGHVSVGQRALGAILEHTGDTLEGMELAGTEFGEAELAHLRGIWLWPLVSLPESVLEKMEDTIRDFGVAALPAAFPQG